MNMEGQNNDQRPLRVLHLEDSRQDAELIQSTLEAEGLDCDVVHVKNREQFETAVMQERFDVILSDYALPNYNGFSALEFARQKAPDVPFILLSGTLGEELAVESLKTGATDYILKGRLNRLVPAVRRALQEAEEHARLKRAQQELQQRTTEITKANEALRSEIAERKRVEEHLRQAQKMEAIGQLAGGIAHDFNNILGCIVGYAELAVLDISDKDAVQEGLHEVLKASQRAKELVLQILTFSRRQEQERRPMRLQPVLKEAMKLLRASLPATIEIRAGIDANAPTVLADATQIHQIIMNLATNAAHAMSGRPGELGVGLRTINADADFARAHPDLRMGRYASLSISDTGCGMDRATIQRIFEPFFTTKAPGEGTGLGLAVVHGIVKSHEGAVTVYSEPGKGTTFHLYFPIHESAAVETVPETEAIVRGSGERVLFVDDEASLASLGKKMLERIGYQVTTKTSSSEALAAFRAEPGRYDLVITDLTMPNLTGTDLAVELLKLRPDLPIILATGFGGSMNSAKAQTLGLRELLMKPVTAQSLAEAARRALAPMKDK